MLAPMLIGLPRPPSSIVSCALNGNRVIEPLFVRDDVF
jgi:hypothetical protein